MPTEAKQCLTDRLDDGSGNMRFDYDCVPSQVAKFLKGQADRIRRQCVTSIIQIGKGLIEAKRHLSHGQFLRWVEGEVGMPVRTAQAYTRVASWASTKGATVAYLAPSSLYLLSASNTPIEFVADVLSRVEAGERIAPAALRRELAALRETRRREHVRPVDLTQTDQPSETRQVTGPSGSGTRENAMFELIAILARGLSDTDFERVREIATSNAVLSDPKLAETLSRAFLHYERSTEATVVPTFQDSGATHSRHFNVRAHA
jgi:hypothetical protein